MTEIKKYVKHYIVHYKRELEMKPTEISNEWWQELMKQMKTEDFIMINWVFMNKYNISHIEPYNVDYEEKKRIEEAKRQDEERKKRIEQFKKNNS